MKIISIFMTADQYIIAFPCAFADKNDKYTGHVHGETR